MRALGQIINQAPVLSNCPATHACIKFTVVCPEIANVECRLAIGSMPAGVTPKGVLVLCSSAAGSEYYGNGDPGAEVWLEDLRNSGWLIVRPSFKSSWWGSTDGVAAGMIKLACRPATVFDFIHRNYYLPLNLGRGRFLLTGNSAGGSQIAYGLAQYGLDTIIDTAIITAGPPHAVLTKSCMFNPAEEDYWFLNKNRTHVDKSYGIMTTSGPCATGDSVGMPAWTADSIIAVDGVYNYPDTKVHQIIGQSDPRMMAIGGDYRDRLAQTQNPVQSFQVLQGVGHELHTFPAGRVAIKAIIDSVV